MLKRSFRTSPLVRFNNLVLLLLCVALGASLASRGFRVQRATAEDASSSIQEQKGLLRALENAFTSIADQVEPTVVSIEARANVRPTAEDSRQQPDDPNDQDGPFSLPDLFRRFGTPQPRSGTATGSGIIVQRRGQDAYVLTNYHVVRDQDRFTVTLYDHSKVAASLVGRDPKTDLAVLKITPQHPLEDRQVARMGNSDGVRVGQWAMAIGSPLRYEATLTVGVISAKGRDLDVSATSRYRDLIQTDAAINPGNSGGPLVNIDGQVVGINVAIASPGGLGNIGIGFAIPVNQAKQILDELITTGQVKRGYLGIVTSNENRELSRELQELYGVKGGALVESVPPNAPAAKAGLRSEDVITRFDGKPINSFSDLESAVAATPPGKTVPVTVVREKKEMTVQVTVALRDSEENLLGGGRQGRQQPQRPPENQEVQQSTLGITVRPSSEASTPGVEISAVTPGSPAKDVGLRPGDIITRVGNDPVRDLATFRTATAKLKPNSSVVLRVLTQSANGRQTRIIVVRPQP